MAQPQVLLASLLVMMTGCLGAPLAMVELLGCDDAACDNVIFKNILGEQGSCIKADATNYGKATCNSAGAALTYYSDAACVTQIVAYELSVTAVPNTAFTTAMFQAYGATTATHYKVTCDVVIADVVPLKTSGFSDSECTQLAVSTDSYFYPDYCTIHADPDDASKVVSGKQTTYAGCSLTTSYYRSNDCSGTVFKTTMADASSCTESYPPSTPPMFARLPSECAASTAGEEASTAPAVSTSEQEANTSEQEASTASAVSTSEQEASTAPAMGFAIPLAAAAVTVVVAIAY